MQLSYIHKHPHETVAIIRHHQEIAQINVQEILYRIVFIYTYLDLQEINHFNNENEKKLYLFLFCK